MRRILLTLLAAAGLAATSVHAYEPESGIWWNPAESGTGYNIEIQDDMMVVAIYGGDQEGYAKWYTAVGRLDGNAYFEADLLGFDHVQPIGQPYTGRPVLEPGYGKLKIVFDPNDNRRATLTWPNGRSIPIQRQEFYFWRSGEDPSSISVDTTKMLGEWQIISDLSTNADGMHPYTGDVLVLDDYFYDTSWGLWMYEGCRPDNAQIGGCSNSALANHDAFGFFEGPSDDFPAGVQVIVLKDRYDYEYGVMWFALYELAVGTNDGSGLLTLYPCDSDPCTTNPYNWAAYPSRAFRSASRTFVQEGVGPAKNAKEKERTGGLSALLKLQPSASKTDVTLSPERSARLARIRQLEARLQAK